MSKIKTKELIICIITIAILVLTIVTDVFATDNAGGVNGLPQPANNNNNNNNNMNFQVVTPGGNNTANNTANNLNNTNNTNNNSNKNNTTAMPNTGVDYSVVFIIAICGISAIYAYKKIKDYNNF